ncbi:NAD(P)/FAD-dependent oxidoreductase [Pseudidiomarina donghaiensis]|uniref:NAD(P)/FAD-dependent oxidoreductase n=1 Tax=Pseudidiomarina donghaiensis TaxID=519452 RepID=UPI003A970EC8
MYDPLESNSIPSQQPHAASYWHQHTQVDFPATTVQLPETADIVVIGGGYSGLNAALELAENYQQRVVLVEANQLGWGCSTRNAGFAMPGTGRLGYAAWKKRCGEAVAQGIQAEYQLAFARLERHLAACPQQLQVQRGGYVKIAHNERAIGELQSQYQALCDYEPNTQWLNREQIRTRVNSPQAHAAIHFPQSFGLNPLLLLASVARQAAAAGATLVENAAVSTWQTEPSGLHVLHTNKGTIRAPKIIVATNGYTPNHFHPSIHGRSLPVLSSVVVTRPLSIEERAAIRLKPHELVMDTRALKYYFRLLPDGRLLFGGRGAIRGRDAEHPRYVRHLLQAMAATFPALKRLSQQAPDYSWSGWVSVALDDYPRIYSPAEGVYTTMGYCGAGVTFTQLAGQRVAQLAMGETMPALPFYQSPLPKFPLPQLRRLGQWLYYVVSYVARR